MAVPESNEVFSKSGNEFGKENRENTLDVWPRMEMFLDPDDKALFDDWASRPPSTPSGKEITIKPLKEKGIPVGPFEKRPILKPLETESTPKSFDIKPIFRTPEIWPPFIPFDNLHPSRPTMKWPPYERMPTMRPLDHLPPIKPINRNWDWDLPDYKYKVSKRSRVAEFVRKSYRGPGTQRAQEGSRFVFEHPKPPPSADTSAFVMKVTGGVVAGFVAGFVALLIIINRLNKKNRTRRGVFPAAAAGASDQDILTDSRPFDAGEPGPFKPDLPPPYYECAPFGMSNRDGEEPPPYTYPEDVAPQDHNPRQKSFIENELRASSAAVAPDVSTELVFDNGRVVERLSRPLNSNNHAGVASTDRVEGQTTRHADFKDRVLYVDETGNVKGHTQ